MRTFKKPRFFLNLFGIAVVTLWVSMVGLLTKSLHIDRQNESIASAQVTGEIDTTEREWKEIYLNDKKVGYSVNLIAPFEEGYFLQEEIFLRLKLMGLASSVYTATQCRLNTQFLLESFDYSMKSGVVTFHVSGEVKDKELTITTGKGKEKRSQVIPLENAPMIGAGVGQFLKVKKIKVGETFTIPLLDPATMAQKEAIIRVVGRESLSIDKISYSAFRLEAEIWGQMLTFWLDENGTTLKEEGLMGLTIVKSSPARAPRDLEYTGEDIDFYESASVKVDRTLPEPSRVKYLKLRVGGIDDADLDPKVLNAGRQRFHEGVLEISRENPHFQNHQKRPYEDFDEDMKAFLEPELNIESDDPAILKKAKEIVRDEDNALVAARRLSVWVYQKLEKRPVLTIPSATEVLKTRVGDCNEHATLLTALLRASGIPAKLSIGLTYSRGQFFYHAWTEAYVGEWISMDATLDQLPVDATHIKLVEGNLDKQVAIAQLIGKLELEVLDFKQSYK
ncbi:MAG: transglutaminase domain-containing protein [Deltaproteobacteria bacterium]|nr:transglutaminase domain-containing protein [Deltaproteobacteria bacterium]